MQPNEKTEPSRTYAPPSSRLSWLARSAVARILESKICLPFFAGLCAIADGITTVLALESGMGYEMNSLAPTSLPGILLHTFLKFAATQYIEDVLPPKYAEMMLKLSCAIWGAAAVSNSFAIMHAPHLSSVLGGVGFVLLFIYSTRNRPEQ